MLTNNTQRLSKKIIIDACIVFSREMEKAGSSGGSPPFGGNTPPAQVISSLRLQFIEEFEAVQKNPRPVLQQFCDRWRGLLEAPERMRMNMILNCMYPDNLTKAGIPTSDLYNVEHNIPMIMRELKDAAKFFGAQFPPEKEDTEGWTVLEITGPEHSSDCGGCGICDDKKKEVVDCTPLDLDETVDKSPPPEEWRCPQCEGMPRRTFGKLDVMEDGISVSCSKLHKFHWCREEGKIVGDHDALWCGETSENIHWGAYEIEALEEPVLIGYFPTQYKADKAMDEHVRLSQKSWRRNPTLSKEGYSTTWWVTSRTPWVTYSSPRASLQTRKIRKKRKGSVEKEETPKRQKRAP